MARCRNRAGGRGESATGTRRAYGCDRHADASPSTDAPGCGGSLGRVSVRRVLLLCWRDTGHPQGGGSELYLERVGAELAAAGCEVVYVTAAYPGAPRVESRDGMTFLRAGGRLTVYPRAIAALIAGRIGAGPLAGFRPDVVVDTQNGVPFGARLVARRVVVLVHHCHRAQWPVAGRALGRIGWFVESRLSPWLHRRSQYLTVSLPSAEDLADLGIDGSRVAVVRAGVDPAPAPAVEPRPGRLVVLSRLVPHKRIEDALAVVAALPGTTLDVVGGGWWAPKLRRRARELGIADRVVFHGHVDDERKHDLLAGALVHLMPSTTEGWGIAVIEAAQHGVPTVGYRASRGLTDSVVDGVTGTLVGDRDGLVAAVADLLADDAMRIAMGRKARRRAAEFSWGSTARRVGEVLEAAADGRRIGGLVGDEPRPSRY